MDPQAAARARSSRATHLLLERGAALRTHVVALEDVHWADAATEDWLARLAESIAGKRVLLLVDCASGLPRVVRRSQLPHRPGAVDAVQRRRACSIAEGLLGVDELPAELQALIVDKAEGNPFFVEELMRSLQEVGASCAGPAT